jgi:hypothetical protein
LADCRLDFIGAKINGGCINFLKSNIGALLSSGVDPRSGFAYEWLEGLKNVKNVSGRDFWRNRPYGVVMFGGPNLVVGA